jgi:O-antigen/teichoic acid export membrane protein
MLVVVLSQVVLATIASHVLAKRPYRWVFRPELAKKKLSFGWPLLVNSLLMFGIFHGDRVLVGSLFGVQTLGWYGVAFSLALLPTLIFAKVCGYLLMPGLSKAKHDPEEFLRQCGFSVALCLACGAFVTTFFAIGGKSVLVLAYGERYARGNELLMWLALGQAVRVIRVAPAMIANSQAMTKNAMYSNMVRTLAIPGALVLIQLGYEVKWIAITALFDRLLLGAVPRPEQGTLRSAIARYGCWVLASVPRRIRGFRNPARRRVDLDQPGFRARRRCSGVVCRVARDGN